MMSQHKSEKQTKDNKLISQEDINKAKFIRGSDRGKLYLKFNFSSKEQEDEYKANGVLIFPHLKKQKNIVITIELSHGIFPRSVFSKTTIHAGEDDWSYWNNCDLSQSIFDEVIFCGNFNCSEANLEHASFRNVSSSTTNIINEWQLVFSKAKMQGINFHNARDLNCVFDEADLTKSNFTLFQAGYTSFKESILINSIFDSAQFPILFDNDFTGANFKGARFGRVKDSSVPFECRDGNFTNANFEKSYISGHFYACKFDNSSFDEAFMVHLKGIHCSQLINTKFNKIYIDKETLVNMAIDKKVLELMYPNTPFFELSCDQNKLIIKPMDTHIFISKLKKVFPSTIGYSELKEHYIFSRGNSNQFFAPEKEIPEKIPYESVILTIDSFYKNVKIQTEIELLPDTSKTSLIKGDIHFKFK